MWMKPESPEAQNLNWENAMNSRSLTVCKVRGEYKDILTSFTVLIIYRAYPTLATYVDVAFLELTCSRRHYVRRRQFPVFFSCRRRLLDVPLVAVVSSSAGHPVGRCRIVVRTRTLLAHWAEVFVLWCDGNRQDTPPTMPVGWPIEGSLTNATTALAHHFRRPPHQLRQKE